VQTVVERRVPLQEPSASPCDPANEVCTEDYEYCYRVSYDRHGDYLEGYYCDERLGLEYSYEYDDDGNIIKSTWYDSYFGDLEATHLYKYDSEDRVIEVISQFGEQGSPGSEDITSIKYDRCGNFIEEDTFDSESVLIHKWTGKYEGSKLMESVSYDSDGSIRDKNEYKYNEDGQKIEEYYYDSKLSLTWRETFQYDNDGNVIESASYNGNGSLVVRAVYEEYEFDSNGEWTKRTVMAEFDPAQYGGGEVYGEDLGIQRVVYTVYRTITYYSE
jgi:hypothetical protein